MGIKVAAQCFSRTITNVFADMLYHDGITLYVDDISAVGNDFQNAVRKLE